MLKRAAVRTKTIEEVIERSEDPMTIIREVCYFTILNELGEKVRILYLQDGFFRMILNKDKWEGFFKLEYVRIPEIKNIQERHADYGQHFQFVIDELERLESIKRLMKS